MWRNFRAIRFFLSALILVSGCSSAHQPISQEQTLAFQRQVNVPDMNRRLQIRVRSSARQFEFGSDIPVAISNRSDQQIFLPQHYGIRLFVLSDNDWIEAEDKNIYYGDENGFVLHSGSEAGWVGYVTTWVRPAPPTGMEHGSDEVLVRIAIIGTLMSNGVKTEIPVAAYTDVLVSR